MPTITIRNGNRTLKLTKRESDILWAAKEIAFDVREHFDELRETGDYAYQGLVGILHFIDYAPANGKPADAGTAGK